MGLTSDFTDFLKKNKFSVVILLIICIASEQFTKSLMDNIVTPIVMNLIPEVLRKATFQIGTTTLGLGDCLQYFIMLIIIAVIVYIAKVLLKEELVINTVLGFATILAAKALLGLKIAITWITVLLCAIGGIEGAIIIILWSYLKITFV